jgi:NAD(P)-dependent dehydrogenase (short-subunit alcohol dehydrogenase family)
MAESVVVTGASKGIGEACVARLVRMGMRVYAGVRDVAAGEALKGRLGEAVVPLRLDVTDAMQIEAARARVEGDLGEGGLRGLVNNAGIAVGGPLELLAAEDLRRQLEVNVIGQVSVTRAFLPLLRRRSPDGAGPPGRIVLMGSIAGRSAVPFMGAYAASKHALEALADALRLELRSIGITVSLIEPGMIATSIWDTSLAQASARLADIDEDARRRYGPAIDRVMGRARRGPVAGLPADRVALVVVHALTASRPRARYLVGRDARMRLALERLLPTRVRDHLVASKLGL